MTINPNRPGATERLSHLLTLVSIGSLFAIYGLHRLFGDRDGASLGDIALLAAQTLPLLVCVPGMLAGSARAAAALAFLAMAYFMAGVMAMADPASRFSGTAEVFFAVTLFMAATLFARHRGQREQALMAELSTATAAAAAIASADSAGSGEKEQG